jgi:drug/metabolite transporter (DMT)-like permease
MVFELSVLAAFGAMLCWGFGDFFIQRTTRRIGDVESLAFIGIIGAVGLLPFVIGDLPLLFSPANAMLLLVLGVITFIAAIIDFEALKEGKLCVVDVILEIELPVTVVLGIVFFGEMLSLPQLAAIVAAFLGIVLISLDKYKLKNSLGRLEKGALLAFVAAVMMALTNFLTAASSKNISPIMAIWVPWVIFTLISLFFIWRREGLGKLLRNAIKFRRLVLAEGIFDTLAWLFFALAVANAKLSVTIAITESFPVIAIMLGILLNRERIGYHQCAGATIALGASIFLGFFA